MPVHVSSNYFRQRSKLHLLISSSFLNKRKYHWPHKDHLPHVEYNLLYKELVWLPHPAFPPNSLHSKANFLVGLLHFATKCLHSRNSCSRARLSYFYTGYRKYPGEGKINSFSIFLIFSLRKIKLKLDLCLYKTDFASLTAVSFNT